MPFIEEIPSARHCTWWLADVAKPRHPTKCVLPLSSFRWRSRKIHKLVDLPNDTQIGRADTTGQFSLASTFLFFKKPSHYEMRPIFPFLCRYFFFWILLLFYLWIFFHFIEKIITKPKHSKGNKYSHECSHSTECSYIIHPRVINTLSWSFLGLQENRDPTMCSTLRFFKMINKICLALCLGWSAFLKLWGSYNYLMY